MHNFVTHSKTHFFFVLRTLPKHYMFSGGFPCSSVVYLWIKFAKFSISEQFHVSLPEDNMKSGCLWCFHYLENCVFRLLAWETEVPSCYKNRMLTVSESASLVCWLEI